MGRVKSDISSPTISFHSLIILDSLNPLTLKILLVILDEIEFKILGFVFFRCSILYLLLLKIFYKYSYNKVFKIFVKKIRK